VPRAAVAIALPGSDFEAARDDLAAAGYEPIRAENPDELERLLADRDDVRVAILDCETDFDSTIEMYAVLHEGGRNIPALILMPGATLGRMTLGGRNDFTDEYFSRPFTAESLRWRIDAMLIRGGAVPVEEAVVVEEIVAAHALAPAAPVLEATENRSRGRLVIVFNPKGGVGKTTVSINLAAALQLRKHLRVLIIDCDTVTGHVGSSLGLPRLRTLAEAWVEGDKIGIEETVKQVALAHSSGVEVLALAATPFHTEVLVPARVAAAVAAARADYDIVVLDLHPDFGPLNLALFDLADRILVPVTPDMPCVLAAVQFREVASALEMRERLLMVINRANSGIAPSKVERTVGLPTLAMIRSAGPLFFQASDDGKSAVEKSPDAKAVGDIDRLADRLLAALAGETIGFGRQTRGGILRNLFGRRAGA
jgi:MinD-like ATPase involved in chromosome partitioning or flagellar assembly